jgi:ArsR family transcriptional regulator
MLAARCRRLTQEGFLMEDRLQSAECAKRLKALADRDRLKIIQCLQAGPKSVSALSELLGAALVNVSHHLRVLHRARLVRDEKHVRSVVYSLRPDAFRPKDARRPGYVLDLGCCRLVLGLMPRMERRGGPKAGL